MIAWATVALLGLVAQVQAQVEQQPTHASANTSVYRLIRFHALPTASDRAAIAEAGIQLLQYQGNRTYWAACTDPNTALSAQIDGIAWAREPIATDKTTDWRKLAAGDVPSWAIPKPGFVTVQVLFAPDRKADFVKQAVQHEGFDLQVQKSQFHSGEITLATNDLPRLAALPFVFFLHPIDPPSTPEGLAANAQHRSNLLNVPDNLGRQFDGSGVGIMLQDDGIVGPHIDYQGRIGAQYIGFNNGNHADHIAGILHGAGNRDPLGEGIAKGAELFVYDATTLAGFDSIAAQNHYQQNGIRVISTSYANGCNTGYTLLTSQVDRLAIDYPGLLSVFSAGNSGAQDCGYGAGLGWGNITGGHKSGKNVLAIGSLNSADELAFNSSRGPATDGRIKPDLCAKGVSTYSTIQNHQYDQNTGTSFACPAVSGVLAQLTDAFRDLNANNDPESGLLKAIVLNTADDLGNPGPDFKTGWGRLNALRAVEVLESGQYGKAAIDQGGANNHTFNIPAGIKELKVMVYWTDPEGMPGANKTLVNDLDFTLAPPGSGTLQPFILDPTANASTLDQTATTGTDTLNNMEQIVVDSPTSGTYTIQVAGSAIAVGPQSYYWVYAYSLEKPRLAYPGPGASLVPGETVQIRWDAAGTADPFDLEYQSDPTASWTPIASGIAGKQRQNSWVVPNTVSGTYRVRITRSGQSDSSSIFSVIEVPQNVQLGEVCPDSIWLQWDPVSGASSYDIYRLGSLYMDSIGNTTVDSFRLPNDHPLQEDWFSVRARGANNARGRRAVAIFKTAGVFNCNLPVDLQLEAINNPGSQGIPSCLDGPQPVIVSLHNNGSLPLNGFQLNYQLNGNPPVSEIYSDTLHADSSIRFQFSQLIPIALGTQNLDVWTALAGDENPYNDSLTQTFTAYNSTTISPINIENFEAQDTCSENAACAAACPLVDGWWNALNGQTDDVDWRVDIGGTPSGGTGPNVDHNPGTASGKYLYIEASNCANQEAHLISPCIDLSAAIDPKLVYWYHMNGSDIGRLHVDIYSFATRSWTMDATSPILGSQGSSWRNRQIGLASFVGDTINIRFRGVTGSGTEGDIALDDIQIGEQPIAGFDWQIEPSDDSLLIRFTDESQAASFLSMDLGDGQSSSTSDFVHHYQNPGNYPVQQVVLNLCGTDTIVKEVSIYPLGIGQKDQSVQLSVHPNPTSDRVNIQLSKLQSNTVQFTIYGPDGRLILHSQERVSGQQFEHQISLQHLATGLYTLLVQTDASQQAVKLEKF